MIDPVSAFLHRKPIRRIKRKLVKGEVVEAVTPGEHNDRKGTLIVTNKRRFWVPERGRIQSARRGPMHDVRKGSRSQLVDARKPSWQVTNAPAGAARTAAQATKSEGPDRAEGRLERVERLYQSGRITDAEYAWLRRDG